MSAPGPWLECCCPSTRAVRPGPCAPRARPPSSCACQRTAWQWEDHDRHVPRGYGWVHLSSDLTRQDFGGPASDEHLDAGFRRGLHSLERTALTHSILAPQARTALAREISVVLPTFDEAGTAAQSTGHRLDQDAPASCSPVSRPAPRRPATSSGTATTGHEACAGTCVRICPSLWVLPPGLPSTSRSARLLASTSSPSGRRSSNCDQQSNSGANSSTRSRALCKTIAPVCSRSCRVNSRTPSDRGNSPTRGSVAVDGRDSRPPGRRTAAPQHRSPTRRHQERPCAPDLT